MALKRAALRGVFGLGGRIIPGGGGLLEVALVCQGDEAAVSDHYVVDDGDSYRAADGGQLFCDGAIFGGGGGISGGVVVDQDDGCGTLGDGGAKYFAGVDEGSIQDAPGNEDLPDHAVTGRQKESVKLLLSFGL